MSKNNTGLKFIMWYSKIVLSSDISGISKQNLDIPLSHALQNILQELAQNGWRGLIVGGAVRDAVTGHVPKDIDVEVYGPDFAQLAAVLKQHGHVLGGAADENGGQVIGKAFGVIKFRDDEGNDYDFSLPRRDSKTGDGHTGFDIQVDPSMSPKEAASRRDFTMNALAFDPLTSELHDYYGGKHDLENKILRATDMEKFGEDPLRVLRGMQFAARMGLTVDPETAKLAMHLANEIPDLYKSPENPNGISRERVTEEFMKLATKGKFPGSAIQYLQDTGWIKYFPQIEAIVDVPQEYEWHPEGWSSSIVPSDFFSTSMAQSMPIDLLTRDFIKAALAQTTSGKAKDVTRNTQAFIKNSGFVFNLAATSSTRRCDFGFSPLVFSPTTITPPKSFVGRRAVLANGANKVIPVMFKIPLSRMDSIMQSSVDDIKVVNGIIESVAITMMDMLAGKQFPSQMNLHDVSVQEHTSTDAGDRNFSITPNIMNPKFSVVNNDIVFNFELIVKGDVDTHNIEVPGKNEAYLVNLGGVHTHTAYVMNAAAEIADRRGLTGDDRAVAIMAALGHDFAKAFTTEQREKGGKMRWTAHGHEEAGGPVVQEFLKSIGVKNDIINRVVPLVRRHLNHIQYKSEKIPKGTVRGLAHELYPATIEDLVDLVEADHSGRPPLPKELPQQAKWLLDAAKADNVHNRKPPQILTGKHVLPWFNGKVGPHVGKAVKEAYDAYLKGKYTTPEEAEAWLRTYMKANAQLLRGQDVLPYFGGKGGPQVGQILDKAWDAQAAGEYTDEDAARVWLENYMKSTNQGA